jgi:tetratricopeptide (TPR) repeat protein
LGISRPAAAGLRAALGDYELDRFGQDEDALRRAAALGGWEERDGKEVLYLFLGNVAGKRGRLDDARNHYRRALGLNPEYARAMVGLAKVQFHGGSGQGTCRQVDARGLDLAEAGYRRALTARSRPALSDIDAKAAFGLGRVDFCRS